MCFKVFTLYFHVSTRNLDKLLNVQVHIFLSCSSHLCRVLSESCFHTFSSLFKSLYACVRLDIKANPPPLCSRVLIVLLGSVYQHLPLFPLSYSHPPCKHICSRFDVLLPAFASNIQYIFCSLDAFDPRYVQCRVSGTALICPW